MQDCTVNAGALAPRLLSVRRWMFDAALPFWAQHGLEPAGGGFIEELGLDGAPTAIAFTRTRVQARQIYVFAHAHLLGWQGPARQLADRGLDFLLAHGWLPDGGWACRLGRQGGIADATLDLYDQAFVMLALGWHYRAFGEPRALDWARRTMAVVRSRLARTDGRGYWAALPAGGECLQNPHMHLLEAMLALAQATGEAGWLEEARQIAALLETTLFDPVTGTLGEYFDPTWRRQPGARGRVVEPGHHFEWVWLLGQYRRLAGHDLGSIADRLYEFGCRHGAAPATGLIYDAVTEDGFVLDARHRCWPQTEALKAHLAMAEAGRPDPAAIARVLDNLLDRYLAHRPEDTWPEGTWIDQFDAEARPLSGRIPASTLYHVFLAFAEALRLAPVLAGPAPAPVAAG